MKAAGIAGVQRRRYRKTMDSAHDLPIAPNILSRQFDVTAIATTEHVRSDSDGPMAVDEPARAGVWALSR